MIRRTTCFFLLFFSASVFAQSLPIDQGTIADIVEKEGGAVVNIDIIKNIRIRTSPFLNPDDFFGYQVMPEFRNFSRERIVPQRGAGSGFFIDKRGYVITNEHVTRGAAEIIVTTRDGKKYAGKIAGADPDLDIAVIKIDPQGVDLPVLPLGDSANLRPGEWVIAIGNPYGFSNSVTSGIISATGRVLGDIGKKNLIQIDAAINPGNSGGPLLDSGGYLIGVSTMIYSPSGVSAGIGFAIPVDIVAPQPLTIAFNSLDPLCTGNCNGWIAANVSGGTTPYSYLWDAPLASVDSVTSLCAGMFHVTVTDANGCMGTSASVNVNESANLSPVITGTLTYCTGSNTTLDAGTYTTYNWSTGAATPTITATVTDNPITVTVTDANGCSSATVDMQVIVPPPLGS